MRTAVHVIVASIVCLSAPGAFAQGFYTGSVGNGNASESSWGGSIDASLTGTSRGANHASLIGTIAPFSKLEESGVRVRLGGILGSYSYVSATPGVDTVVGRESTVSALVGYEWVSQGSSYAAYIGAEGQNRTLSKPDPGNKATGVAIGVKASVDFMTNPTANTMVSGNLTYSSNNSAYYARLKAGMAMTDKIFVGPEVLLLGDKFYKQYRVGAHLTGAKFGRLQFGVSGGYLMDRDQGSGAYGILDARVTF